MYCFHRVSLYLKHPQKTSAAEFEIFFFARLGSINFSLVCRAPCQSTCGLINYSKWHPRRSADRMEEGWPDTVWAEYWHGVNHRPICPDSYSHHNGSQLEFQIVRPDGQSRVETKTSKNIMTIVKRKKKHWWSACQQSDIDCISKPFFGQFASLYFVPCSSRGTTRGKKKNI